MELLNLSSSEDLIEGLKRAIKCLLILMIVFGISLLPQKEHFHVASVEGIHITRNSVGVSTGLSRTCRCSLSGPHCPLIDPRDVTSRSSRCVTLTHPKSQYSWLQGNILRLTECIKYPHNYSLLLFLVLRKQMFGFFFLLCYYY